MKVCGEAAEKEVRFCAAPLGLDFLFSLPTLTASLTLAFRVGSIISRLRRWAFRGADVVRAGDNLSL